MTQSKETSALHPIDKKIRDANGHPISEGDTVEFSYGIPPVNVKAPVIMINGRLYASTPDHKPKECLLSTLERHVGWFEKLEGK